MKTTTVIKAEGVSKRYNLGKTSSVTTLRELLSSLGDHLPNTKTASSFWALKDVSFEIKQGEVVGIIGRNGAGKSTLLKILSRITPPTEGQITMQGRISSLLEVGTGFNPELTGRENIFLNGSILGMSKKRIRQVFDEIVDFSGVEKFIDTPVKRYSSGMYVRLAFSVAAYLQPDILVIDEVLSVGDASFQKKCLGKMEDVAQSGRTVLFVSHNIAAVRALCSRGIVLESGKVVCDDVVDKAISFYNDQLREVDVDETTGIGNENARRGSGSVRFNKIEILNIKNKPCNRFKPEDTVRMRCSFAVNKELEGLRFSVAFKGGLTKEIITSVKYILSKKVQKVGTQGTVVIDFPKIPFRVGEYALYFYIGEAKNGSLNFDVLDELTAPLIVESPHKEHNDAIYQSQPGFFNINSKLVESQITK